MSVRSVLVEGEEPGEQRHHDDAPTHPENSTEQPGDHTNGEQSHQAGLGSRSSLGHAGTPVRARQIDGPAVPVVIDPELTTRNVIVAPGGLVTCRRVTVYN